MIRDAVLVRSPLTARPTIRLLAVLVGIVLVFFGLIVVVLLTIPLARSHWVSVMGVGLLLVSALLLIAIDAGLRRNGTTWAALGFRRVGARLLHLVWQIPLVFLILLLVQGLVFAVSGREPVPEGESAAQSLLVGSGAIGAIVFALAAVLLTPLWEEAVFRGLIHGSLRRRFNPLVASLISAALFAAAHGVPMLIPYLGVLGLSLAWLREFHGTLWAPVLMHMTLNGVVTAVTLTAIG